MDINITKWNKLPIIVINVKRRPFQALIDIGSSLNLYNIRKLPRIQLEPKIAKNVNNTKYQYSQGITKIPIIIGGYEVPIYNLYYYHKLNRPFLLGIPFISTLLAVCLYKDNILLTTPCQHQIITYYKNNQSTLAQRGEIETLESKSKETNLEKSNRKIKIVFRRKSKGIYTKKKSSV